MTPSWTDLQWIEKFLTGRLSQDVHAATERRIAADPDFNVNVVAQQRLYSLITMRGRDNLRRKLMTVHEGVVNNPANTAYRTEILKYFERS